MPYLVGLRDQNQLFPASIEEYIDPEVCSERSIEAIRWHCATGLLGHVHGSAAAPQI
jgi:hypothetical protein